MALLSFNEWMSEIERILNNKYNLTLQAVAGCAWQTWYEGGVSFATAAKQAATLARR